MKDRTQIVVLHALSNLSNQNVVVRDVQLAANLRPFGDVWFANVFAVSPHEMSVKCDLLLVTDSIMTRRGGAAWRFLKGQVAKFAAQSSSVAMIVQDDYQFPNRVIELAENCNATIFSVFADLPILYPPGTVQTHSWPIAMTDERLERTLEDLRVPWDQRSLDLCTRVTRTTPRYGKEGRRKAQVALEFGELACGAGLRTDVSENPRERLEGIDWLRFIAKSKFTVGRHGGASRITRSVRDVLFESAILRTYSRESFDVQLAYFDRRAPEVVPMLAESPRFVEAAGLDVVQILEETTVPYQMSPWEHYVPLSADGSNVGQVLQFIKSDEGKGIGERCRKHMFSLRHLDSAECYGSMASHFGLRRLHCGQSGEIRRFGIEVERKNLKESMEIEGATSIARCSRRKIRKLVRDFRFPANALFFPWETVDTEFFN